jgi:hypothetical protein
MSAHRYWRIFIYYTRTNTVPSIAEIQMRDSKGGSDLTGSGTASANNALYGAASNAFDNNTSTFWAPNTKLDSWISYDFGAGNSYDIVELAITNRNDIWFYQAPQCFNLMYSDDGIIWIPKYYWITPEWTNQGETKVFNDTNIIQDGSTAAYRYYRIFIINSIYNSSAAAAEIELRESSSGSDVTGSGTASASSQYSSSYSPDKAFDNNSANWWVSNTGGGPWWIKYDFGAGVTKTIVEISYQIRTDSYATNDGPVNILFQGSNDDSNWDTIKFVSELPTWYSGETRIFTCGTPYILPAFSFVETFENFDTDNWNNLSNITDSTVGTNITGMGGTKCLDLSSSSLRWIQKYFSGLQIYSTFRIRFINTIASGFLIIWGNKSTGALTLFRDTTTKYIKAYDHFSGGTLLATGTTALEINTTYKVQVYYKVPGNGTTGRLIVKINNNTDIDYTGIVCDDAGLVCWQFGTATAFSIYQYIDAFALSTEDWPSDPEPIPISLNGITSLESFGTANLELFLFPSGISSEEAFGSPTLDAGGSAEAITVDTLSMVFGFGSLSYESDQNELIVPSGIASSETFGTPTVIPGASVIIPSGITTQEVFGTPTIIPGTAIVAPSGITTREAFGTARIGMNVLPAGISSEEDVSSPYVFPGGVHIIPTGIASTGAFGNLTITCGEVAVSPEGIDTDEALGTPLITYIISAAGGIGSEEAFGTATLNLSIQPNGIDSQEDFGLPWVIPGPVWLYPSGINSEEALGTTPQVNLILHAGTIDSEETFGTPALFCGPVTVWPYGIPSAEAFGRAIVWVEPSQYFILELDSLRLELVDGDIGEIVLSTYQPQRMVVNG